MDLEALKAYTLQYWAKSSDTHVADPTYYRLAESELRKILEKHLRPHGNVLDVGCGNGEYTALLAEKAGQLMAFDVSDSLLAAARKRCERFDNVSFFQADVAATSLAFGGGVDAVFCMGVFACLPDEAQLTGLLYEFADYLVDGGLLVLRDSTVNGPQQYVQYPSGHLGYYRNKTAFLDTLHRAGFDLTEEIPLKAVTEPYNDYFVLHKRAT